MANWCSGQENLMLYWYMAWCTHIDCLQKCDAYGIWIYGVWQDICMIHVHAIYTRCVHGVHNAHDVGIKYIQPHLHVYIHVQYTDFCTVLVCIPCTQ